MLTTKPTEIAQATTEQVWNLLYDPEKYSLWWDAETLAIEPAGHAHAGQKIIIQATEFGKKWNVEMSIKEVDAINYRISVEVKIPFGVIVREVISCVPIKEELCRITYDAEIMLPAGLKGRFLKTFFSKSFTNSISISLKRLKTAAEKIG